MSQPRIEAPEQSSGFLLWHVTLRWQREVAAALDPLGLTHVQFVLLACTWWMNQETAPNQLALARQAGTDVKMTSQVLAKLEAKSLLVREVDPADTRAKRLRVTPAGADLAQRAIVVVDAVDAAFFATVSDQPALRATLSSLRTP